MEECDTLNVIETVLEGVYDIRSKTKRYTRTDLKLRHLSDKGSKNQKVGKVNL